MRGALLLLGLILAISAAAESDPDFVALEADIDRALATAGSGGQPGERIELDRFSADGWEMRIIAAWDGASWRLLALRLHHPERVQLADPGWLERHQALLAELNPDRLDRLQRPQLFEVPPPDFLPALPGESRSRQFEFEGYWYRAGWINRGGPDVFARWRWRSFELVADRKFLEGD